MSVLGIHHITAISADIVSNLAYYTGVLGLRLVKKSINQDDVKAYHLFYADAQASPGTDFTFFDWPEVPSTRPGGGTVALTCFSIREGSLDYWMDRLEKAGSFPVQEDGRILFSDPEGQRLALVTETGPVNTVPWTKNVPAEHALRGFSGLEMESLAAGATAEVLVSLLGFERVSDELFQVQNEDGAAKIRMTQASTYGQPGAGGIHHVAFRARDDAHLTEIQEKVERAGLRTSGYIDRFYFHSLYFREPGGVLFEIATDGPGMHIDEDMDKLGEKVSIPPFMANRRAAIEAGLKPLPPPSYGSEG